MTFNRLKALMRAIRDTSAETATRLHLVAVWREATVFTEAERAALELAEQGTRIADAAGGVTDEAWENAAKHYDEEQLSGESATTWPAAMMCFRNLPAVGLPKTFKRALMAASCVGVGGYTPQTEQIGRM